MIVSRALRKIGLTTGSSSDESLWDNRRGRVWQNEYAGACLYTDRAWGLNLAYAPIGLAAAVPVRADRTMSLLS